MQGHDGVTSYGWLGDLGVGWRAVYVKVNPPECQALLSCPSPMHNEIRMVASVQADSGESG
jgi:hypothetical protein